MRRRTLVSLAVLALLPALLLVLPGQPAAERSHRSDSGAVSASYRLPAGAPSDREAAGAASAHATADPTPAAVSVTEDGVSAESLTGEAGASRSAESVGAGRAATARPPDRLEAITQRPQFLSLEPSRPMLRGEVAQQLVVMGYFDGGQAKDITHLASFRSGDENVVRVTEQGLVLPVGDGAAEVLATFGGKSAQAVVTVSGLEHGLQFNFANDIVPIFTRIGCNAGMCHGKASGQNGFKLSLLGSDPEADYEAIVKEARGRRVSPAAPDRSLVLRKPNLDIPHGGGRKLSPDMEEYKIIRQWIASGMPFGQASDPRVVTISTWPRDRVMGRRERQQLIVTAHLSDGSTRDVTRRTQYQSQDPEVAAIEPTGLVETRDRPGETTIMARYQGHVVVFRAKVPHEHESWAGVDFEPANFIDRLLIAKWMELGVKPSPVSTDEQFIRRASLDICGTLPRPDEIRTFVADRHPEKRAQLIDRLLDRPEYAANFALKWADILHNQSRNDDKRRPGTIAFYNFIRSSVAADKPYDQFASEILTAQGAIGNSPAVAWYRDLTTTAQMVDNTAQVFLGVRIQCAQCHHHPTEKWGQDDYFGLAAFFARVGRQGNDPANPTIVLQPQGEATHPRSGQVMRPRALEGRELDVPANEDRRARLAQWLRQPDNPYFARAAANRMWAHFFGRGIVEPIDDMRVTNPPVNPQLLDALAQDFAASGFRTKQLVRTICNSRAYQLGSDPTESNRDEWQHFTRYYPKRMIAEVLFDALSDVTNVYPQLAMAGLPQPVRRALDLPDEAPGNYFLRVFGKPSRETACECERTSEGNLAQVLHLLSSDEVQTKIAAQAPANTPPAQQPRAQQCAADLRLEPEKVEDLFLWAFSRRPAADELADALSHLEARADNKKQAYEDLLWALINAKEFQFIR